MASPERPPQVHTMILEDKPRYTIFFITTKNATAVRNDDHATAPPFLHLNDNSNITYPNADGTTHVGPFDIKVILPSSLFLKIHPIISKFPSPCNCVDN